MNPTLLSPAPPACLGNFALRRAPGQLAYHQLTLSDAQGHAAHWVLLMPLKQLNRRPMMLWELPATPPAEQLPCLERGELQLAPAHSGLPTSLPDELHQGLLRLHFEGEQLRGYYRLQRLPTGGGQLWQLTAIGHV